MKADYTWREVIQHAKLDGDDHQMKADYTRVLITWHWRWDGDNRQMKADYTMYESAEKR